MGPSPTNQIAPMLKPQPANYIVGPPPINQIASALNPIQAIAWGEEAMCHLGVDTILNVSKRKSPNDTDTDQSLLDLYGCR